MGKLWPHISCDHKAIHMSYDEKKFLIQKKGHKRGLSVSESWYKHYKGEAMLTIYGLSCVYSPNGFSVPVSTSDVPFWPQHRK